MATMLCRLLLLLALCIVSVSADGIDDEMNDLASDIGKSLQTLRYVPASHLHRICITSASHLHRICITSASHLHHMGTHSAQFYLEITFCELYLLTLEIAIISMIFSHGV